MHQKRPRPGKMRMNWTRYSAGQQNTLRTGSACSRGTGAVSGHAPTCPRVVTRRYEPRQARKGGPASRCAYIVPERPCGARLAGTRASALAACAAPSSPSAAPAAPLAPVAAAVPSRGPPSCSQFSESAEPAEAARSAYKTGILPDLEAYVCGQAGRVRSPRFADIKAICGRAVGASWLLWARPVQSGMINKVLSGGIRQNDSAKNMSKTRAVGGSGG